MSVTGAFVTHEVRTQMRSLRFRVLAVLYLLAGSAPAVLAWSRRLDAKVSLGPSSYAWETMSVLPVLTAVFAFLISLDAISREQDEGAWSTVTLTGLSSAGYLLRRWLALQALLLPLAVLPVLVAAVVAANGTGAPLAAGPFLGPWLLHVVPIALALSALGVGVGTIAGSSVNAFLLGAAVLGLVPTLVNFLLGRFGLRFDSPFNWLGFQSLVWSFRRITSAKNEFWLSFPLETSQAPFDFQVMGAQYLSMAALPVALAGGTLGIAVRHLRRTRADVRPWRVAPGHPLRTFITAVARLRERYTPDPKPSRADLLVMGLALLAAAGFAAWLVERGIHFQKLGRDRFAAELSEGPAPTPAEVVPGRWRVEGTVGSGREVTLLVTAEMRNGGAAPQAHLAFELNPFLRIEEARANEGEVRLARRWDRLAVDLAPPIPPGGSREIRFRLAGSPRETSFALGPSYYGFHKRFAEHTHARFYRDLYDLSKSHQVPSLSRTRIELAASDLTPIPRYQPWKLAKDPNANRVFVSEETFRPQADVSLSLSVPRDLFLANACGGTGRAGRLEGRCRLPLGDLLVAGGDYNLLPAPAGGARVAVFPSHRAQGELHLGFLARGTRTLEEAWPGLGGLERMAVLEWPPEHVHEPGATIRSGYEDIYEPPVRVRGNLLLIREWDLIRAEPLKPDTLVAELVASRLAGRRAVDPSDAYFFRQLFRELALQQLGLGAENGAVVTGLRPGQDIGIRMPPPAEPYSSTYWRVRFPALVAALRYRMGEEALRLAVDELLARRDNRAVTRDDLYALLKERSERPLDAMIGDYFVKGALPEPFLEGVEFRRAGEGWRVTGRMRNRGTGEALCKVVLTTDLGPLETVVRAAGGGSGGISFSTPRRPQAVLLDPDQECHRLGVVTGDRVFFEGNS